MTVVNFRCDPDTEAALEALAVEGESRSETIRRAIHDAMRFRRREQMRAEALEAAQDPDDVNESKAVLDDLASLRAW
ncbi:ribbon-helix-helix protein, CopG family [Ammonicoccus fulvus]|uniref:Ribbon-helix-helix protein, CopG family n=1 Tax=Ammonicoccus fulvus TaxID=3138240 RepID=A0ABZ3FTZ5_9ACTN